ncbi:unnamed protein product, partial [Musa banksii]
MASCTRSTHPVPRHYSFGLWLTSILLFTPTTNGCVEGERDALLDFKTGIVKDPSSRLSSWRGRVDCCRWSGVVCDNRTGHVVELNLQNSDPYYSETSIGGEIRPSLLLLTHLERLNLSHNDFGGIQIPKFLGSLTELTYLDLSWSNFGGAIPPQLGNLSRLRYLDLNSLYDLTIDGLHWLSRLTSLRYLYMGGVNLSVASHDWLQAVNMLSSLEELHLQDCGLTNLHSSLSHVNLTTLATLDLHGNLFNSTFPNWLWKLHNLSYLDLSFSTLHGAISAGIGNLTGLRELHLSDNSLSGPIPVEIGNLTGLGELHLNENSLSGPVPIEIGKLSNLTILSLSSNSLEGTMSELHFANLTKLSELDLFENSLVISIDHNWVPPFQLRSIKLSSCKLGPAFPRWLRSQNSIKYLDMSNTSIEDVLPDWFWNNSASFINLSQNQINGTLPTSLVLLSYLRYLNLACNSLSGSLPSIFPTLELRILDLSRNHINGSIPSFICNCHRLDILDLSSNQISGEIPSCWQETNYFSSINLANNKLSGEIPSSIENLIWLESFHLNNNKLHGLLPSSLKNCSALVFLDLGNNKFSGSIPTWIAQNFLDLEVLRLRSNMFSGNIPAELGQLAYLHVIDLANNKLSGPIPHSFGNLNAAMTRSRPHLTRRDKRVFYSPLVKDRPALLPFDNYDDSIALTIKGRYYNFSIILYLVNIIDLSNNNLTGEIPIEIGSLSMLQTLNLSRNNFVGQIPAAIGAMKSLETLDLSFNKLSGVIPQSFSALNSLNHLNLSYNNLSGAIPSGNQLRTLEDASIYIGNVHLCGPPVTKSCSDDPNVDSTEEEYEQGSHIRPSLLLLTHLERLNLSHNDLSTDGLHWLSRLTSLRYLDMSFVNLSMASHDWLQAVNMLSSLEELHLHDCGLTDIPSSLSHVNLTALATLDISDNLFNSTIPKWLWKLHRLSYLDLSFSMFHGAIPAGIGNLADLRELHLSDNSLSGPVPTEIGNLNSLELINLTNNLLSGSLPTEIGKLSNLNILSLSSNSLEGTVSELHFARLTKLSELDLSENSLVISVDYNWVPPFQLRSIQLKSCKLGPAFPRWLRSQNSIEDLGMSNTSIEDVLPDWFWNNSASSINLSQNQINGTLPTSLEDMTNLAILKLSMNLLEGPIPRLPPYLRYLYMYNNCFSGSLSSISLPLELELLDLSHNHISGNIPSFICNLTQLRILDLSSNQISGEIPWCWQETNFLFYINLADNKLSGEIPSSIEKLTQLRSLHLNNNSLHGHLPLSLKHCSGLVFLDLGDNKFSGSIPTWIAQNFQKLEVLRLCSNMFFGNIPIELGQLHHLHIIDLANNNLSGPIPRSFGNLNATKTYRQRKLTSLGKQIYYRALAADRPHHFNYKGKSIIFSIIVYLVNIIDFSNNNLTGEIPLEIGSLSALQTLNLSRNNLIGQIPATIGGMKLLETLDLSFNKLSGGIPQSLSDLYSLNHL